MRVNYGPLEQGPNSQLTHLSIIWRLQLCLGVHRLRSPSFLTKVLPTPEDEKKGEACQNHNRGDNQRSDDCRSKRLIVGIFCTGCEGCISISTRIAGRGVGHPRFDVSRTSFIVFPFTSK